MRPILILAAIICLTGCNAASSFAPDVPAALVPAFAFNGVLATYNNPATGSKLTNTMGQISMATDHDDVEYPDSGSYGLLTTIAPSAGGVGWGRALSMTFSLPAPDTQFAAGTGCATPAGPGTSGYTAYAYVSIEQGMEPAGSALIKLSQFHTISFWVQSTQPAVLELSFVCATEIRPQTSTGAIPGYLDAAYTQPNPCWYAGKSQMTPSVPLNNISVAGGSVWQKFSVPLSAMSNTSTQGSDGSTYPCGLSTVLGVVYTFTRHTPGQSGVDTDINSGTINFDDVVFQ